MNGESETARLKRLYQTAYTDHTGLRKSLGWADRGHPADASRADIQRVKRSFEKYQRAHAAWANAVRIAKGAAT